MILSMSVMTRADLVRELSRRRNIPVARAESVVDAIFGSIEATLSRGERVVIRGLGTFCLRQRDARVARNPRVKRVRLLVFEPGAEIRERIQSSKPVAPNWTLTVQGGAALAARDLALSELRRLGLLAEHPVELRREWLALAAAVHRRRYLSSHSSDEVTL